MEGCVMFTLGILFLLIIAGTVIGILFYLLNEPERNIEEKEEPVKPVVSFNRYSFRINNNRI